MAKKTKKKVKKSYLRFVWKRITQEDMRWLNRWCDLFEHPESFVEDEKGQKHLTEYGKGYKEAVSDVWWRLSITSVWIKKRK